MSGSVWQAHQAADGKPFWYNTQTKQSHWEKPEELKSPLELALAELGWKQYESAGKPYYVSESKETTWEIPADVKAKADQKACAIAAQKQQQAAAMSRAPTQQESGRGSNLPSRPGANGQAMSPNPEQQQAPAASLNLPASAMQLAAPGQFAPGGGNSPFPGQQQQFQNQNIPRETIFETKEQAEEAFFELLRSHNVTPAWTWEQVLRATVTDPSFKALRTLQERKDAFGKYCDDIKRREREVKERSMERNRPSWRTALGRLSEGDFGMKAWWSWERAAREIRGQMPEVWAMSRNDEERKALWEEYMHELETKENLRQQELRQQNIEKLAQILKNLSLDLSTRYQQAVQLIKNTKDWGEDTELQSIDPLDFLIVYEESVKKAEQEAYQEKAREKTEKQRQIRKNREAYIALLQELVGQGKIKAGTKWKDVFVIIKEDDRFIAMLANPGSTPLELFWDIVDDLDQQAEEKTRIVENVMSEKGLKFDPAVSFESWDGSIKTDARVAEIKEEDRQLIYNLLQERVKQLAREEKRRIERKLKHQIDDLRYALRDVKPVIAMGTSYEDALPSFSSLPEYKALEDETARKSAFDRHIKRMAEKLEEEKLKTRDGYGSDTASHTSRRTRHRSRLADASADAPSPRNRADTNGAAASPPLSTRAPKDREASPARSRRETSRERERDGGDLRRDRDRRERDSLRERDDDRHGSRSRSYKDRDSRRDDVDEGDRRHDRRGSSRREEERPNERSSRDKDVRREDGSRRSENRDRERTRDRDRGRDSSEKDRRSRRLDERSRDRKDGSSRDTKRARLDGDVEADKEEGEI